MADQIATMTQTLQGMLKTHIPSLKVSKDSDAAFEVSGTMPAMQGKKKVDGYYFATVVPKPKDVRLYFFPIYTHVDHFADIPEALRKCLKGKSCFHIKKLDGIEDAIKDMVQLGVDLYKKDGLI